MKMPWTNRTGLAKAATILTTILAISTGFCGLNAVATLTMSGYDSLDWAGKILAYTGGAELILMVICILGLLLVVIAKLIQRIRRHRRGGTQT